MTQGMLASANSRWAVRVPESALEQHVGLAQALVEVCLVLVEVASVGACEPLQQQVGGIPYEEGQDAHVAQLPVWDTWCKAAALYQAWQGRVPENLDILGTANPASADVGEEASVV